MAAPTTETPSDKGLIQPIVVRPHANGGEARYEIVAGERRYRAAKLEVVEGRAVRWRPVEVIVASSMPVIETEDGKRFQVFRSSLHWQPNARTNLPVEAP